MSEEKQAIADSPPEAPLPGGPVRGVFARYGERDYALIPHRNRYARWMFMHNWLVPLALLGLTLFFSGAAVFTAEDPRVVGIMLRIYGPRFRSYEECTWQDEWGTRYGARTCPIVIEGGNELTPKNESVVDLGRNIERVQIVRHVSGSLAEDEQGEGTEKSNKNVHYLVWIDYTSKEWTSFVMSFFTLVLGVPLLLSLMLMGLLIAMLARRFPRALYELANAGRLLPGPGNEPIGNGGEAEGAGSSPEGGMGRRFGLWPRNWRTYGDDLDRAVVHPVRFAFFVFWLLMIIYFAWSATGELGATKTEVVWSTLYALVVFSFGSLGAAYVLAFIVWYLIVVAGYLRRVTPIFSLDIQPEHGDGCGGLQRLGQVSLIIALVIAIPSVVIAILWWLGLLTIVSNLFIGVLICLAVLLVLAPLAFFGPLWRVHTEMATARARYQDEAVANMAPLEQKLRALIVQGRLEEDRSQKLDRELTRLQGLYPATARYPTWPFSTGQLLTFLSSQVVTILTIAGSLVDFGDRLGDFFP